MGFLQKFKQKSITDTFFSIYCFEKNKSQFSGSELSELMLLQTVLKKIGKELKLEGMRGSPREIETWIHDLLQRIKTDNEVDKHFAAIKLLWLNKELQNDFYVLGNDLSVHAERIVGIVRQTLTDESLRSIRESYLKSKNKYQKKFPSCF